MTEVAWDRLKAAELRALAAEGTVVIVPVASVEQHGPHLPTMVDVALVGEIARRAAQRVSSVRVVVTPVVWTGLAEHHMSLGGTISLNLDEFFGVIRGICRSLVRQGFKRILLLNGHGGNVAALTVIVNELTVELNAAIATTTYWLLARDPFAQILERQNSVRHACEAETSMMLALQPGLVDMAQAENAVGPTSPEVSDVAGSDAVVRWRSFAARTSHGVIGDPRNATADKGERLLEAAADDVARLIGNIKFWELSA